MQNWNKPTENLPQLNALVVFAVQDPNEPEIFDMFVGNYEEIDDDKPTNAFYANIGDVCLPENVAYWLEIPKLPEGR